MHIHRNKILYSVINAVLLLFFIIACGYSNIALAGQIYASTNTSSTSASTSGTESTGPSLSTTSGLTGTASTGPTVVSPGSLADREQASLSRQYQFQVRNKAFLVGRAIAGSSGVPAAPTKEELEQEKLYRYFGVAVNLYKEQKLEEAAEILQYILDRDPEDEYIKSYLARVQKEMQIQKSDLKIADRSNAIFLKKKKIETLVQDGIDSYKNRDYDTALLKFADALGLDPNNATASAYMNKLKQYYLKEMRVENIVQDWTKSKSLNNETGKTPASTIGAEKGTDQKIAEAAEKLLNDKNGNATQKAADETINKNETSAKPLSDDEKMKKIILDKRAGSLLEQADLGYKIKEIIDSKELEEKKSKEFTLGPGDIVQISVRDHPELSGLTPLRLKGDIVLPLVNDTVIAKGLTVDELSEKVTEVLRRYVQDPYVNVSIVEYKSKVFYVLDENSCTPYPITRADTTLRDALFISDWGDNRALGRVLVIKPSKRYPIVKKVDAFELIFRGNLENNIRIDDGDVIYVPMTYAAKVTKTIFDTLGPFRAVRVARDEYLSGKWNQKDWEDMTRMPTKYDLQAADSKDLPEGPVGGINFVTNRR